MTDSVLPRIQQSRRTSSGQISRLAFSAASGMGRYVRWSTLTMWHSVRLLGAAALETLTMVWFTAWLTLSMLGIRNAVPPFETFRRNTSRQRRWAEQREAISVHEDYGPDPDSSATGINLLKAELTDSQRAKDLDWHLVNPGVTLVTAALPLTLAASGIFWIGYATVNLLEYMAYFTSYGHGTLEFLVHVVDFMTPEEVLIFLGLVAVPLLGSPLLARLLQKFQAGWTRYMLSTSSREAELTERVEVLTETRKTALELQTAEIQRIERDLHDGAQAHLVTVGMTLTQVSRLMRVDPDAAEAMLDAAKKDSATALRELRTLVRGIRPPVLADRGLSDALRSLASGLPIETTVTSTLSHRPVAPVESALYFAISELLTNAMKHSAASEVNVELSDGPLQLRAVVTDNGIGGAEGREQPGGGIHGIRRRLEPFDGVLDVLSPLGGGTTVTLQVPHPSN